MIALALIAIGLMASYKTARERFTMSTSLVAAAAVALGTFVSWQGHSQETGPAATIALASIACAAWRRLTRARPAWLATAGIVVVCLMIATPGSWAAQAAWTWPQVSDVLWSSRGGLLATSPVVYLALIGLAALWKEDRHMSAAGLVLLAALACVAGARGAWWIGARPSAAAFGVLTPFLVTGAAAFFDRLAQAIARRPATAVGGALALLVLWNATLMDVAHSGGFRIGEPVSFGDLSAGQARTLHDWIGHPASYPANLVYSIRNGVPPGRYDVFQPLALLGAGRGQDDIDIGGDDALLLGAGWHSSEREGDRSFRWATASAELVVPLDRADDLLVRVHARPFTVPGGPPQQLAVVVNGRRQPAVELPGDWSAVAVPIARSALRTGVNRLTLTFTHQARPLDMGATDDRWLAAAIDRVTFVVR